jgi:hypothetical protein
MPTPRNDACGAVAENVGCPFGDARVAAQQEYRLPAGARGLADRPDHARSRDSLGQRLAGEVAGPGQWHPISDDQVRVIDQRPLHGVATVATDVIEVRRDRPVPAARLRSVEDRPHGICFRHDPHRRAHEAGVTRAGRAGTPSARCPRRAASVAVADLGISD